MSAKYSASRPNIYRDDSLYVLNTLLERLESRLDHLLDMEDLTTLEAADRETIIASYFKVLVRLLQIRQYYADMEGTAPGQDLLDEWIADLRHEP